MYNKFFVRLFLLIYILTAIKRVKGVISNDEDSNQLIVEYYSFDDTEYLFFSQRVTWEEANIVCSSYNARLAILDNSKKAFFVATSMAESNIVMEDAWLGGRKLDFNWVWSSGINSTTKSYKIPLEPNIDGFPPWSREPMRPMKDCLAIDRKSHSHPNFVDLDCRLLRPFICEKKSKDVLSRPIPSKWVQFQKSTYILYHGRVTWIEAVTFCRSQGARLAVIKNQSPISTITKNMVISRPDFENVWIGAHFFHGQWTWLSTGSSIHKITDDSGYPPWRSGKSEKNSGCLLLDRHFENISNFIETSCDRKRDFLCEEYSSEELEEWMNEPITYSFENMSFIIYPFEKTWDESRLYCEEKGSKLAYVENLHTAKSVVTAMGDHPKEISHVWLGGLYHLNKSEWRWLHNNYLLSSKEDDSGFPPWVQNIMEDDLLTEELCLNLDRSDHIEPHFYGLNCETQQPFACSIDCDMPPPTNNGTWKCDVDSDIKSCLLNCDTDFLAMGLKTVKCSLNKGWYSTDSWLEFPICLDFKNIVNRLIRSLTEDVQNSAGYYVLLSHADNKFQQFSLNLIENLLNIFSDANLKTGFTSYINGRKRNISYTQNSLCPIIELISSMKLEEETKLSPQEEKTANTSSLDFKDWAVEILNNNDQKTVIVAIIDSLNIEEYQEIIEKLKWAGHFVMIFGSEDDGKLLSSLATIGFDQRLNVYLFQETEFEPIIAELINKNIKPVKCEPITNNSETTDRPNKEYQTYTTESTISDVTDEEKSRLKIQIDETTKNLNEPPTTLATTENETTVVLEETTKNTLEENENTSDLLKDDDLLRKMYMGKSKNK